MFDDEADRLKAFADRGVELIGLPALAGASDQQLDLRPLLEHLCVTHRAMNVLVEGGAYLNGALLQQGLADQVLAFVAPKVVGDGDALGAVVGMSSERISDSVQLTLRSMEQIGDDVLLDYRTRYASGGA
jgi:diaminohydroxyphosphoribosylaminopyrimidine deaminase/5-amino-6-(5-phosphoribosylamino)uracil reductase